MSYQWQKGGANISGATSSSYTTPAVVSADNGASFRVVVTNGAGSVTSNSATLTVVTALPSGTDVTTFHNDNARTGQNLTETILTPANVNSQTFGLLRNLSVDGKVDAEPLYLSQLPLAGGVYNVVFIVTEHDSVYAFDSDTGAQLWKVSLLGAGETTSDNRGCGQVSPEIGITSTPVIDRKAGPHGTIYVVAMSKNGSNYFQRIHALDVTTGAELLAGPVTIQASYPGTGANSSGGQVIFDPKQYKERSGLLLLNGVIYTTWSSHCDISPYTAWIIGYDEANLSQSSVLDLTPNGSEGSIWQSGGGPAADAQGNIYALIANGTFDTTLDANGFPTSHDYGNAFVKVSTSGGTLQVADYFNMDEYGERVRRRPGSRLRRPAASPQPQRRSRQHGPSGGWRGEGWKHLCRGPYQHGQVQLHVQSYLPGTHAAAYRMVYGECPPISTARSTTATSNGTLKSFTITNAQLSSTPTHTAASFTYPGLLPQCFREWKLQRNCVGHRKYGHCRPARLPGKRSDRTNSTTAIRPAMAATILAAATSSSRR